MQASQAKSSTVTLPRAIVRRSAAIQARIDAQNAEAKPDSADLNALPASEPIAQAAPPTDPPAEPVPPTRGPDPRNEDAAYWKHRYEQNIGVLNKERREGREAREALHQQMTEMQEQIRTLQAAKPSETALDLTQFFTPAQIEQFGEEQCEAMAKASMKSATTAVQQAIDAEVKPLREAQERTKAQTVEDRKQAFTDKLTELVPNYADIDVDPDWLAWLAQEDEATGLERQGILNTHISALNAAKVAKVFSDYLKSKTPKPVPPVVGAGRGAGPSGEPPPVAPAGLKPLTDAEVKAFFKRSAILQGRMPESERNEFEARMKLRTGAR